MESPKGHEINSKILEELRSVTVSENRQHNFKHKLFSLVSDGLDNTYRVVGFLEDGENYILIKNTPLLADKIESDGPEITTLFKHLPSHVEIPLVILSKELLESAGFNSLKHLYTSYGILSKPSKGDNLMCIGMERYVGAEFGKQYDVKYIKESKGIDRVGFGNTDISYVGNTDISYDGKYFIVISRTQKIYLHKLPSSPNPCGEITLSEDIAKRKVLDEEKTDKRVIIKSGELIRRPIFESGVENKRAFFKPDIIRRKIK